MLCLLLSIQQRILDTLLGSTSCILRTPLELLRLPRGSISRLILFLRSPSKPARSRLLDVLDLLAGVLLSIMGYPLGLSSRLLSRILSVTSRLLGLALEVLLLPLRLGLEASGVVGG